MKRNLGIADRLIRLALAALLGFLLAGRAVTGAWAVAAAIILTLLMISSLLGFCSLYVLMGISTCHDRGPGRPMENSKG